MQGFWKFMEKLGFSRQGLILIGILLIVSAAIILFVHPNQDQDIKPVKPTNPPATQPAGNPRVGL